jgi:hypothetical protein
VIRLDQPRGCLIVNVFRRRPLLRAAAVGDAAGTADISAARRAVEAARNRYARDLEQRAAASAYPRVPAQAMPSLCDGLAQLNSLHDRGALNDGEFAGARAKLLGLALTPQASRRP